MVSIPAQHQTCNDVISAHAYTSVLSESCDLSARRAASPKLCPGCCGGDRSLDIIISSFLSPGHPGSLFVYFISPVTGNAQLSTARIKKKRKTNIIKTSVSVSSSEDRNILKQAKPGNETSHISNQSYNMALIVVGVCHICGVASEPS